MAGIRSLKKMNTFKQLQSNSMLFGQESTYSHNRPLIIKQNGIQLTANKLCVVTPLTSTLPVSKLQRQHTTEWPLVPASYLLHLPRADRWTDLTPSFISIILLIFLRHDRKRAHLSPLAFELSLQSGNKSPKKEIFCVKGGRRKEADRAFLLLSFPRPLFL